MTGTGPTARVPVAALRADARRNISAILDAALASLGRNPDVNMAEIARNADVGRVTLYAHFPSKADLVDAVVAHAIARADEALDAIDLDADPPLVAVARLTASSWQILSQHRQLMIAGQRHLGAARMRSHHDKAMDRVRHLITRGQKGGHVRTDLPRDWLVATYYALLHAAVDEVSDGRLKPKAAGEIVAATIIAALAQPSA